MATSSEAILVSLKLNNDDDDDDDACTVLTAIILSIKGQLTLCMQGLIFRFCRLLSFIRKVAITPLCRGRDLL